MAEKSETERKKLIEEIMDSIKEYTKEDINDPEEAKSTFDKLLKTHRPIKLSNYEYGLSFSLKKDYRLIIKEENDETNVREYFNNQKYWCCTNSRRKAPKCLEKLIFQYGIIFAPIKHIRKCETNEFAFVMEIQNALKEGNITEARRIAQLKNKSWNDTSDQSLSTSMLDESSLSTMENDMTSGDTSIHSNNSLPQMSTPALIENIPTSSRTIVKRETVSNNNTNDENSVESSVNATTANPDLSFTPLNVSTPALTENIPAWARSRVKREAADDDSDDCMIILEPPSKRHKIVYIERFSFYHPSTDVLEAMCEKVDVRYSHDAFRFWVEVLIDEIPAISSNIQTHSFKSSNIFACLTQFFTGKVDRCFKVQDSLSTAFRNELKASGELSNADIDQICSNNTVTEKYLEFITKFLSCRIGIYENETLKKFGKWETEENALALILSFENGLYSVVLDV
uniref:SPK domain-containing protein n=1 Tax=Panagrolaimus davidi TaxID=227884 RepID=A0A914PMF3_9BILA